MSIKKPLRKIHIDQLAVGMCVVGMDISWIDSPFLTHTIKIKKPSDIDKLRSAGARQITINPNKGDDLAEPEQSTATSVVEPDDQSTQVEPTAQPEPDTSSRSELNEELSVAKSLRSNLTQTFDRMMDELAADRAINGDELAPVIDQTLESLERNSDALMSLAHMSERAKKLADHAFSTYCIALNMARFMNKSADELQALGIAALLHDTGWMSIPLQLMGKRQRYTDMETKLINKHPELGIKKLKSSELPELVYRLIVEHHECDNGSGYPKGLTADDVHPLTKILTIADTYDELTHQLRDVAGMLPGKAMRSLFLDAKQGVYDQECVNALIGMLGIYPVTTAVRLSNNEKGIVIEVPPDQHLKPIVEVKYDANGKLLKEPKVVNLAASDDGLDISESIDPKNTTEDPYRALVFEVDSLT